MEFINPIIVACSVLITPLIEAIVKPFISDKRLYPVASILIGLGFGSMFFFTGKADLYETIVSGIVAGLTASGLYSTIVAVKK